jgi:hypothetical protein
MGWGCVGGAIAISDAEMPPCMCTAAFAWCGTTPAGAVFCSTGGAPVGNGGFDRGFGGSRTRTGGCPGAVAAATGGSWFGGGLPMCPICDFATPSGAYDGFMPAGRFGGCLARGFSSLPSSFRFFPRPLLSPVLAYASAGGFGLGGGRLICILSKALAQKNLCSLPKHALFARHPSPNNNQLKQCTSSIRLYVESSRM